MSSGASSRGSSTAIPGQTRAVSNGQSHRDAKVRTSRLASVTASQSAALSQSAKAHGRPQQGRASRSGPRGATTGTPAGQPETRAGQHGVPTGRSTSKVAHTQRTERARFVRRSMVIGAVAVVGLLFGAMALEAHLVASQRQLDDIETGNERLRGEIDHLREQVDGVEASTRVLDAGLEATDGHTGFVVVPGDGTPAAEEANRTQIIQIGPPDPVGELSVDDEATPSVELDDTNLTSDNTGSDNTESGSTGSGSTDTSDANGWKKPVVATQSADPAGSPATETAEIIKIDDRAEVQR